MFWPFRRPSGNRHPWMSMWMKTMESTDEPDYAPYLMACATSRIGSSARSLLPHWRAYPTPFPKAHLRYQGQATWEEI